MDQRINKTHIIIGGIMGMLIMGTMPFISFSAIEKTDEHYFYFEDIYDSMHKNLENGENATENIAKEYVGNTLGASTNEVEKMMNEDPNTCGNECLLKKYCIKKENIQNMIECKSEIIKEVSRRKSQLSLEKKMHNQTLASQAFVNGTLQDTGSKAFDIIVDLNIVDVLFFGDKMSRPTNGSLFLPKDENHTSGEPKTSPTPTASSSASTSPSASSSASPSPSASSYPSPSATPINNGFCMAPDSLTPSYNPKVKDIDDNNGGSITEKPIYDGSIGNLVDQKYKNQGGTYPDMSRFKKNKKCGAGEKSFFYGRICIPEFCNELICIKIDMKMQTKAKSLSPLNCTECHIDRANEALNKMMGTLGQNTPNSNSMEPYFLRAIANLFKNITSRITIAAKPLPFLVYDEAIIADKKESEKPDEQKTTEKTDARKKTISEKNTKLYTDIVLECPEMIEHFSETQTSTDRLLSYCQKVDAQRIDLNVIKEMTQEVENTKNVQNSISYEKVVKPFYEQMSGKIVSINALLKSITPEEIAKTNQHCKSIINQ